MSAVQSVPQNAHVYEKSSVMKTTIAELSAFHEQPDAFNKLNMPPIIIQMHGDNRTSMTEGDLKFTMWLGPIPVKWHVEHQPGPTENSFADMQLSGPMGYWRHEHIYEQADGGARLIDRVTIAHKPGLQGLLTRLMFDGLPLRILFFYRHLRTKFAVEN